MRNFKIIVITLLLLILAGLALFWLKELMPNTSGPDEDFIDEIYHEDHDAPETDELYDQTPKQYEGVVKPLGISIYQEGTHRLEKDDQLIALLESEKVVLSKYEESEVKVTGVVRDTVEGGQKIMKVSLVEEIKASGVKAFSDVSYDFSFSYPADWEPKKEKNKVTFSRTSEGASENIMIVYQYPDAEGNLETWLKDRDQNLFFKESQVKVGDVTGVRRTITNGDQEIIKTYTKAGSDAYELRLVSQDEAIRNQYLSIVDGFETTFAAESVESEDTPAEEEADSPAEEETPETPEQPAEEETEPVTEDETPAEETEGNEETTTETAEEEEPESTELSESEEDVSFLSIDPLSADQIQRVIDKGFTPFEGRTLSFDYPSVWYFTYLPEDRSYGFTDDSSYKSNDEEVTKDISRILLIVGQVDVPCSATVEKTIDSTTYTVCTREPGLTEVAQGIAATITKPSTE